MNKINFNEIELNNNENGFTLIEVLIAIAIFSICMTAMTAGIINAHNNYRTSYFADQAVMAGQERIEMLAIMNIAQVVDPAGDIDIGDGLKLRYTIENEVDADGDGINDFATVAMEVFYSVDNNLTNDELRMKSYLRRSIYK